MDDFSIACEVIQNSWKFKSDQEIVMKNYAINSATAAVLYFLVLVE